MDRLTQVILTVTTEEADMLAQILEYAEDGMSDLGYILTAYGAALETGE